MGRNDPLGSGPGHPADLHPAEPRSGADQFSCRGPVPYRWASRCSSPRSRVPCWWRSPVVRGCCSSGGPHTMARNRHGWRHDVRWPPARGRGSLAGGRTAELPSTAARQADQQYLSAPMIGQTEIFSFSTAAATCVTTICGTGLPTCRSSVAATAWSSGKRQTAPMQVTESEL